MAWALLTVAGLQTISKKANYDALQRTQASLLAHDIIERMRAEGAIILGKASMGEFAGSSYNTIDGQALNAIFTQAQADAVNAALERMANDRGLLREMAEFFLVDVPPLLQEIRQALERSSG